MTPPEVSVIMPVFNCEDFIGAAIESILNQTLKSFELVIIDDSSSDHTAELVAGFDDERIILVQKKNQTGLVHSLNTGITMAKGKYIARMDGDDISDCRRLEKQVDYFEKHPDIDICGTAYQVLGSSTIAYFPAKHDDIKLHLLDFCPIAHPTVMIRKKFLDQHQLRYNPAFICAEDYELWTRTVWIGKMANIPEPLLHYRLHPQQFSNTGKTNQAENSGYCRISMLQHIWPDAKPDDTYSRAFLFGEYGFKTIKELRKLLVWMDELVAKNNRQACFETTAFTSLVSVKKRNLARRYLLTYTPYTPGALYNAIAQSLYRYLSISERIKLTLKCLIYWKPKTTSGYDQP